MECATQKEPLVLELAQALVNDAIFTYKIDLTTGEIYEDIVDRDGINYMKVLGLDSPCRFDDLISRSLAEGYRQNQYSFGDNSKKISTASLLDAFEAGEKRIEAIAYFPIKKVYNKLVYLLLKDPSTNHKIAYVICTDVSPMEIKRLSESYSAQRELAETDDIIASANIGIWEIVLFDDEVPRMSGNKKMMELLGVENDSATEEEIYLHWFTRVKQSSLPAVLETVENMKKEGRTEVTYVWRHPKQGEIYVRCGGTSRYIEGKGFILRGYHTDVSDIVSSDIKYRQLLSEALDETRKQKQLLQKALDSYKQADYDRRTDFLTGLRNRLDMYELLQDKLSGKRDEIRTMFMMDIDDFKMLNDRYGHSQGDECLRKIGDALIKYGKENEMYFYRYGGEEILGISLSDLKPANQIAQELVDLVFNLNLTRDDSPFGVVTVSLGYATNDSFYEGMIDKADKALYFAKSKGKNCCASYNDSLEG